MKQDETIDIEKVTLTTTLKDLEFDSFGAVALMFDLEEVFHVELTDQNMNDVKTVGDIVVMLQRLCEGHRENA